MLFYYTWKRPIYSNCISLSDRKIENKQVVYSANQNLSDNYIINISAKDQTNTAFGQYK
jgi:hypothetical protein